MSTMIDAIFDGEALRLPSHLNLIPNTHYSVTIEEAIPSARKNGNTGHPRERASTAINSSSNIADAPACGLPSREALADLESRAWNLYDRKFKSLLEPACNGQTIAIDLDSEDYEVATRRSNAWRALKARRPDASLAVIRIGPVSEYDPLELRHANMLMSEGRFIDYRRVS